MTRPKSSVPLIGFSVPDISRERRHEIALDEALEIVRHQGLENYRLDLGDGERSLDDILDEADAEIAAAKDIEACALGKDAAE